MVWENIGVKVVKLMMVGGVGMSGIIYFIKLITLLGESFASSSSLPCEVKSRG